MTAAPPDFGDFWFSTQKLVALMERNVARRLRAELGIGSMQYRVLSAVQIQESDFIQQDVAEMLGTTSATVSRQIDAAASEGYVTVEVSASSRRENTVRLTAAGLALVSSGDAVLADESAKVLVSVDQRKFATTVQTIHAMLGALTKV